MWRPMTLDGGSSPLPRNAATLTAAGDRLLLHAGWKPFVETYNDTFIFEAA